LLIHQVYLLIGLITPGVKRAKKIRMFADLHRFGVIHPDEWHKYIIRPASPVGAILSDKRFLVYQFELYCVGDQLLPGGKVLFSVSRVGLGMRMNGKDHENAEKYPDSGSHRSNGWFGV
jgi:hypothetical protein